MIPPAAAAAFFHAATATGAPAVPDSTTPTVGDLVAAYQADAKAVADAQAALAAALPRHAASAALLLAEVKAGGPVGGPGPNGATVGYELDQDGNLAEKTFRPLTAPATPAPAQA